MGYNPEVFPEKIDAFQGKSIEDEAADKRKRRDGALKTRVPVSDARDEEKFFEFCGKHSYKILHIKPLVKGLKIFKAFTKFRKIARFSGLVIIAGSANGRPHDSESCNLGSNPSPAAAMSWLNEFANLATQALSNEFAENINVVFTYENDNERNSSSDYLFQG